MGSEMAESSLPLKRVVHRDEVPEGGLAITLEADKEARAEAARLLDIPAVEHLSADLMVSRWRGRGLAVRGRLEARVEQTCVVTLEPVHNRVEADIEEFFAPGGESGRKREPTGEALPAAEDIEPLVNNQVDVGQLVTEHLALNLDPYPRCADVEFDAEAVGPVGETDANLGPFAALEALKRRRDER